MTWGNPSAASFEKRHVRMVVVDHHRVKVHRLIAPLVERVLLDLAEQGLTAQTSGWEPGGDGRRVRIEVDGLTPDRASAAMELYGFSSMEEPFWFEWQGMEPPEGYDDALTGDQEPIVATPTPTPKKPIPSALRGTERLGSRALRSGDSGADVLTLQVFLGVERTGVFDSATAEAVRLFHERRGFVSDGSMSLEALGWIIPRTIERLRTGAAGITVILLWSSLIAKGVLPLDTAVNSRYTVALAEVVRDYRESIGLPRSDVVDSPTWASLIDQPRRP